MSATRPDDHEDRWIGVLPYALIAAGALLRVVPHPANFAPIGALALFGGAVLPRPLGILTPLAAMFLSDAALGFYPGMVWVYGSYAVIALLGAAVVRRRTLVRITAASLCASILFFAVTNFGEWFGPLYPHTLAGLRLDYLAAIPFFRNTVVSDLCYSLALFGIYEFALRAARRRRTARLLAALHRTT